MTLRHRLAALGSVVCATACVLAPNAMAATQNDSTQFSVSGGSLAFSTVPALPSLGAVTLNGSAQSTHSTMTNFGVNDATGSGSGWNVTVQGQSGGSFSPVFAQYCPIANCAGDGAGYVGGGASLPADSLALNSTGASFAGGSGGAPALQCDSSCFVDNATPVKVASAALNSGMGTWSTQTWSGTSLALATPANIKLLKTSEVYRADFVWSLTSGP
jgi:hypothetical protein